MTRMMTGDGRRKMEDGKRHPGQGQGEAGGCVHNTKLTHHRVGVLTCKVDTTARTPSVSIANNMALAMCSGDETVPDKVTTPLVVLTEMLKTDRARSATSLALIAAVIRASAPASAMACPASRALRRTTWPVRAHSSLMSSERKSRTRSLSWTALRAALAVLSIWSPAAFTLNRPRSVL